MINRRQCNWVLLGGLVLATARGEHRSASPDLAACLPDRRAAAAVGAAYLRAYPEYASRETLLGHLALPDEPLTRDRLLAAIQHRIGLDFAHQRTVLVERWLISRTEAALCGLIALSERMA